MRVLYVFIPQPPENHHDINNEVSKKVPDKGVPVNQENKKKKQDYAGNKTRIHTI
jgi:hypothetical protein